MTPDEWAATIPLSIDGPHSGCHPMCPTHRAISDAIRATLAEETARCARIARSPRTGTWDAYSLAEAIAREIEERRA